MPSAGQPEVYIWKSQPFVRLLPALILGIGIQHYWPVNIWGWGVTAGICLLTIIVFAIMSLTSGFTYRWVVGIAIHGLLTATGAYLAFSNNLTNHPLWIGHHYATNAIVLATINEPLVEKAKTYKAEANLEAVYQQKRWNTIKGKVIIYFSKETFNHKLNYGSQVLFAKSLEEIERPANPASFNYKQYNAFKGIYHQVFLKSSEYKVLANTAGSRFQHWLYQLRQNVINTLQQYIPSAKEAGVAEALLIGYRNNLDKDLVQAYSNTGVVHIIAISGLHLGIIYAALQWLLQPWGRKRLYRFAKPIIILVVLWLFTLLAGGVPSILRSAVMFSFIVFATSINRNSNIFNTLAASAFVLLSINPFYLWDVGFQLSYLAVLSIIVFQRPIYNWLYTKNKLLDGIWKLTSVTLAAQVLTLPLILYAFKQFPLLFLFSNLLIVPWSTIVLFAELALLVTSVNTTLAKLMGSVVEQMLFYMNRFIEWLNTFQFAIYKGAQNSSTDTILLYVIVIAAGYWLLHKHKISFYVAALAITVLTITNSIEYYQERNQQKLIVYHVPQHQAIDVVLGRHYAFIGDGELTEDGFLRNFHLQPARTSLGVTPTAFLKNLYISRPFIQVNNMKICIVDKPYRFYADRKIKVDVMVLSHNAGVAMSTLSQVFDCNLYVIDGSNSAWKINQWKKDGDSLHLRSYITAEKGAFVVNIP